MAISKHRTRFERFPFLPFVLAGAALLVPAGCSRTQESSQGLHEVPIGESSSSTKEGVSANSTPADQNQSPTESATRPNSQGEESIIDAAAFLDASLNGKIETVRQAVEAGMDVDATDDQQRTALLLAAFNGHTPLVALLLEHGATLGHRDATGRTALMYAATGANGDAVRWLLEKGAEPNAVDTGEGFTPLMHAAAEGQLDVVRILLRHDADATITDVDGDTATDFAGRNGHSAIVRLLSDPLGVN